MRFTKSQKLMVAFWVVIGAFWCYDVTVRHEYSAAAWLGLVTVVFGLLAQIQAARKNPYV